MPTPSSGDTPGAVSCPNCRVDRVEIIQRIGEYSEGSVHVTFPEELSRCAACGEEFYTYAQSLESSRAMTAALRESKGLMSPERIKAARIRLGMSTGKFEQALGLGKKTMARWERGTVPPSSAANFALWVAERHPDVFIAYANTRLANTSAPDDGSIVGQILQSSVGPIKIMNSARTGRLSSSLSSSRDTPEPVRTNVRESISV
jgi:HTH-type transcriptional regulator / antitoxin MqsA